LDRTFSDQEREVSDLSDEELAVVTGGMMQFSSLEVGSPG